MTDPSLTALKCKEPGCVVCWQYGVAMEEAAKFLRRDGKDELAEKFQAAAAVYKDEREDER